MWVLVAVMCLGTYCSNELLEDTLYQSEAECRKLVPRAEEMVEMARKMAILRGSDPDILNAFDADVVCQKL